VRCSNVTTHTHLEYELDAAREDAGGVLALALELIDSGCVLQAVDRHLLAAHGDADLHHRMMLVVTEIYSVLLNAARCPCSFRMHKKSNSRNSVLPADLLHARAAQMK
jgi:hypothetical protein